MATYGMMGLIGPTNTSIVQDSANLVKQLKMTGVIPGGIGQTGQMGGFGGGMPGMMGGMQQGFMTPQMGAGFGVNPMQQSNPLAQLMAASGGSFGGQQGIPLQGLSAAGGQSANGGGSAQKMLSQLISMIAQLVMKSE